MSVRKKAWVDPKTGKSKEAWMIDFTYKHPDGRKERIREVAPVASKLDAKKYEDQIRQHLLNGSYKSKSHVEAAPVPTLAEFAPRFIEGYAKANKEKPSSVRAKEMILRVHVVPWFGDRHIDQITDEDVQLFKASLLKHEVAGKEKERKPKTLNNVLTVLNTLLRVAYEWLKLDAARRPKVRLVKVPKTKAAFYEPELYERFVTMAATLDRRILLTVLLAGEAGLREGEIAALEWNDVDLQRKILTVRRSVWEGQIGAPKSGKERVIPLTTRLAGVLRAHRDLRPRVLYTDAGETVERDTLSSWVKRLERRMGMPDKGRIHIFRHTFCSRLAAAGAPAMAIKEMAGHEHILTTQRYMHLSPKDQSLAIHLLESLSSGQEGVQHDHGTDTAHRRRGGSNH